MRWVPYCGTPPKFSPALTSPYHHLTTYPLKSGDIPDFRYQVSSHPVKPHGPELDYVNRARRLLHGHEEQRTGFAELFFLRTIFPRSFVAFPRGMEKRASDRPHG